MSLLREPSTASAGLPKSSNYASATNFIVLHDGDGLELDCDASGHAHATASFAFTRSDIGATVVLTFPITRRVRAVWQLHGSGISDLSIMLRRMDPWTTAADGCVSTSIKPHTIAGEAQLMLPADGYQLCIYGSLQSNTGFRNPDDGAYGGHLSVTCARLADVDFDGDVNASDLAALLGARCRRSTPPISIKMAPSTALILLRCLPTGDPLLGGRHRRRQNSI